MSSHISGLMLSRLKAFDLKMRDRRRAVNAGSWAEPCCWGIQPASSASWSCPEFVCWWQLEAKKTQTAAWLRTASSVEELLSDRCVSFLLFSSTEQREAPGKPLHFRLDAETSGADPKLQVLLPGCPYLQTLQPTASSVPPPSPARS